MVPADLSPREGEPVRQRAYVGKHRRPATPRSTPGVPGYAASVVLAAAAVGGLNVQPAAGVGAADRQESAHVERAPEAAVAAVAHPDDPARGDAGDDAETAAEAAAETAAEELPAVERESVLLREAAERREARERSARLLAEIDRRREAKEAKERARELARQRAEEQARRRAEARAAREAREREARAWVVPVHGYRLTATFGETRRWSSGHTGQDFAAPSGAPVRAAAAGEVVSAGWDGAYGQLIVVRHADGSETWYAHLSSIHVSSGPVAAGTVIGAVGSTGNSSGPHLHFEVRPGGGDPVDPLSWLRAHGVGV